MKFLINKDQIVSVSDKINPNSGSINYYEAEVEYDETWNDLNIEAIIVGKEHGNQDIALSIAVIDGKFYIDRKMSGLYSIGFIGYVLENEEKTLQISTNLSRINFDIGAGEIETTNSEEVPTPTEWEIYLAQVDDFIDDANDLINQANNLDITASKVEKTATITVTKKDGETESVEINDGNDGKDGISTLIYYENEIMVVETINDAEEVGY